jgi:hypothetical protein
MRKPSVSSYFSLGALGPLPRIEVKDTEGNTIFARPWSSLAGRDLSNLSFVNADFSDLDLSDTICRNTSFIGCKFVGAKIRRADLRDAQINFCDLSHASLAQSKIHGTDFASTSFGDRRARCDMQNVEGLGEALIDPHELVYRGKFDTTLRGRRNKDVPLSRAVRKARIEYHASRALRPRCLLLQGDPMGPNQSYEHTPKPRKPGRRRTRYPRKGGNQPASLSLLQYHLPRKGQA